MSPCLPSLRSLRRALNVCRDTFLRALDVSADFSAEREEVQHTATLGVAVCATLGVAVCCSLSLCGNISADARPHSLSAPSAVCCSLLQCVAAPLPALSTQSATPATRGRRDWDWVSQSPLRGLGVPVPSAGCQWSFFLPFPCRDINDP